MCGPKRGVAVAFRDDGFDRQPGIPKFEQPAVSPTRNEETTVGDTVSAQVASV
jgi:hypothetical protein